ncbi:DNA polymerase III subunit gamma/tau [Gemmatimonadota bacterium]
MSDQPYEVTARKYRPQTFADVVGQDHILHTLQNALRTGQIAHAYLFSGPRGTGKTTVARLMSKALNCRSTDSMTPEPCGECETCQAIARGNSIDVLEIDGASNRGIDQIRDLRETVGYAALEGRFKIYVIDEVHMLTKEAFNALLKTLEEPPAHVVFIFATTEPTKVLPTILSRVQRYDFRRIRISLIIDTLRAITEKEGIRSDEQSLHLIASKAEGALRDAESMLDQVRAFAGDEITLEATRDVLSVVDADRFFALTDLSGKQDAAGVFRFAAELVEEGQDPRGFILGYAEHLRFLIAASLGGDVGLESILEDDRERYREMADRFSLEDLLRRLEFTIVSADSLRSNPQPWIAMEAVFLRLVQMDNSVDLRELLDRIDTALVSPGGYQESSMGTAGQGRVAEDPALADRTEGVPAPEEVPAAEKVPTPEDTVLADTPDDHVGPDSSPPPIEAYEEEIAADQSARNPDAGRTGGQLDIDFVQGRWKEILEEVRRRKVSLHAFMTEASLRGLDQNNLILAFAGENHTFHINMLNRHTDIIRDATKSVLGHALGVICRNEADSSPSSAGGQDEQAKDVNQQLLNRLCEQDENLKEIVDTFNARLEDGPGGRSGT